LKTVEEAVKGLVGGSSGGVRQVMSELARGELSSCPSEFEIAYAKVCR
jgi:hypothetical protein